MPAFVTFGRILFSVLFIYLGANKLYGFRATAEAIAAKVGVPTLIEPYTSQLEKLTGMATLQMLALAIGAFEVIAGLLIALNFGVRFFAILLILFVATTTYFFYDFWNQPPPGDGKMLVEALKNLSIIGALFMLAGYGRGAPRTVEPVYGDV